MKNDCIKIKNKRETINMNELFENQPDMEDSTAEVKTNGEDEKETEKEIQK